MARFLSRTLLRHATSSATTTTIPFGPPITAIASTSTSTSTSVVFLHHRYLSNQSGKGHLIEIEVESSSEGGDVGTNSGIRKLEELIHRVIVIRSQPAWLPFIPGTSYWVPPIKKPGNIAELLGRLANPLTEDEAMSFTSARGWPSSDYFIQGAGGEFTGPVVVNVQDTSTEDVQGLLQVDSGNISNSEDEEG